MLRPPPLVLLAYRFLGWRVGPTYSAWVHDDIVRPGWLVRQGAPALASLLILGGIVSGVVGRGGSIWAALLVLGVGGLFLRSSLRARALRQQGIDASGDQLPNTPWYVDDRARVRRNLGSAVATVVLVTAGLAILAQR